MILIRSKNTEAIFPMTRQWKSWISVLALTLSACGAAQTPPPSGFVIEPTTGIVASISGPEALHLSDGVGLRLSGVYAPDAADLRKAAMRQLEELALNRQAHFYGLAGVTDRQGHAIGWLEIETEGGKRFSVQEELVRAGLAYVRVFADSAGAAPRLLAAEAEARAAGRGVWANAPIYEAEALEGGEMTGFALVEGVVRDAALVRDRVYLNFGADYKTDFTAVVRAKDWPAWEAGASDLMALEGQKVSLRGFVSQRDGPSMSLSGPWDLAILTEGGAGSTDRLTGDAQLAKAAP